MGWERNKDTGKMDFKPCRKDKPYLKAKKGGVNGKGDVPRPGTYSEGYREAYDQIDWSKKPKGKKQR